MKRNAFTLVELFVVLIIIGTIICLLLPAVKMVRGTAGSALGTSAFSQGDRVGTVVKVSSKGNFTKAYSVEVALQSTGQIWETDIKDNDPVLAAKFRKASRLGKLVEVSYEQPYETNVDYHYNTPYRATGVKLLTESGETLEVEVNQKDIDDARRMIVQ